MLKKLGFLPVAIIIIILMILALYNVGKLVRAAPKFSYNIFRGSGYLVLVFLVLFLASFDNPRRPSTFSLMATLVFYFIWTAKITIWAFKSDSSSDGILKMIWKLFWKVGAIMFPPNGLLAWVFHKWFYVERIQDK